MTCPAIIFSADSIRGGITQQILKRDGIEPVWCRTIRAMQEAVAAHQPPVVILDTKAALVDEVVFLKNLCRALADRSLVLVLGNSSVIDTFEGIDSENPLCLADPIDPERIVSEVKKNMERTPKHGDPEGRTLKDDLKKFLKLV